MESVIDRLRLKLFFAKTLQENFPDYEKETWFSSPKKHLHPTNYYRNSKKCYSQLYIILNLIATLTTNNIKWETIIGKIMQSDKITVKSDKTGNLYYIDAQLCYNSLNTFYTIAAVDCENKNLSPHAKPIVTELRIDKRVSKLHKQNKFVRVKDHKENFYK